MNTVPSLTPVTKPLALTVAISGFLLSQTTLSVVFVTTALSWMLRPMYATCFPLTSIVGADLTLISKPVV